MKLKKDDIKMYKEYAQQAGKRSKSQRLHVGCVLVLQSGVISIGYNGLLPEEVPDCLEDDEGNTRSDVIHAEENAMDKCQSQGLSTQDAVLVLTHSPCMKCAMRICNTGIRMVIYEQFYRDPEPIYKMKQWGIAVYSYSEYMGISGI